MLKARRETANQLRESSIGEVLCFPDLKFFFTRVFEHFYAPVLLSKWVRPCVMILFFGAACTSLTCVPKIGIGLDQELSMPEDSFVLKFFVYMKVGSFVPVLLTTDCRISSRLDHQSTLW